jgi:hypothetical protein
MCSDLPGSKLCTVRNGKWEARGYCSKWVVNTEPSLQEYTTQCYCANSLAPASTQLGQSSCNIPCGGNKTQTCGGSNAVSLYNNTLYSPTTIVHTAIVPGNAGVSFNYTGCYTDNVSGRALAAYGPSLVTPMTVEVCAGICFNQGYTFMGLEVWVLFRVILRTWSR